MKFPKRFVFLLGVASGTCWGTYGTFSRFLSGYGIDSNTISMVVPMFYAIFFFILLCREGIGNIRVKKRLVPLLIAFGFLSAVFNYGTVMAYRDLPIGIVSTIVYCNLFLLMIFSRILFKTPLTKEKIIAAFVAVLGVGLVLNVFSTGFAFSTVGLFWALVAMVFWALSVTLQKYLLEAGVNANAVMVYNGIFAVAFLCLRQSPLATVSNVAEVIVGSGGEVLLPLVGFAFITSMLAYFFYINGLARMETAYVQLGFVMDPLTSALLGFLVFGQRLAPLQLCGIFLVVFVVAWVQWLEIRKTKRE